MALGRRISLWVFALAVGAAGVLGSWRWTLPLEPVRERLALALARDTGYEIVSLGGAAFTAFPWPVLQLSGVELKKAGPSAETAAVPLAKARLNLFSWLVNDPKITALSLFEPRINLVSAETMEETEAVATVIKNYLRSDRRPALVSLRVQAGEVTLDRARWLSELSLTVQNIAGNDLRLAATGLHRGQKLKLDAVVSSFAGASVRPLSWELSIGDLAAAFRGRLVAPPALDAEGQLSVALGAGALRSRPLSLSRDAAELLDGVLVKGEGRVALPQVVLRDTTIERGSVRLQGAVDLLLSTTAPRLAATLHADLLDAAELQGAAAGAADGLPWLRAEAWRGMPAGALADIRLSARRVTAGDLALDDVALSAKLSLQRAELSINEARIGGGALKGRLLASASDQKLELRANGHVDRLDLAVVQRRIGQLPVGGVASGVLSIETVGRSWDELAANLSGKGSIGVRNGELAGIDIDRLLRRPDTGAPAPAGRSAFQSLDATLRINAGIGSVGEIKLRGPSWSGTATADPAAQPGRLDLLARLWLHGPEALREERHLRIEGPLTAPVFTPAASAQFRRS